MAATIVLAEDTYIVREGVRMLLEEAGCDIQAAVEDDQVTRAIPTWIPANFGPLTVREWEYDRMAVTRRHESGGT